jgi:ribonucleoside-diphosphate reductase alpha chain
MSLNEGISIALNIKKRSGTVERFDEQKIKKCLARATVGFEHEIDEKLIFDELHRTIYDGIITHDLSRALVFAATTFIERDPAYNYVAARLFLHHLYKEVKGKAVSTGNIKQLYHQKFIEGINKGIELGHLHPDLLKFDIERLAAAIDPERDYLFGYIGVQTLYERYLLKDGERAYELTQNFWMRVAMGLAINEQDKEGKAIEFYDLLSTLRFVSSTPTLFHSATLHPQLSSCYLTYVGDDLNHIFKCLKDNANMSKWSGGVANSWSALRGTGSLIRSIKMTSQGIVPFLKLANDVVTAIYRSGSRRGATVAYLECWHLDFEDFLDLRRNTGDERRRTHDMNTAAWIPDLFMKRVERDEPWTYFSPDDAPDLHDLYGKAFEEKYLAYEQLAKEGKIKVFRTTSALQLWRKILSRLFETGHPWITFKDACNIRSPQDHIGVVHSSNLCTEITLNTSPEETAVCNLGSVNLGRHVVDGKLDKDMLAQTIKTAVRMLDNVIDINFYPTAEGRVSNMRHRPVGLGVMGLQNALFNLNIPFEDERALEFADTSMELVSYNAILASSELAKERGSYESFKGSKWDRNIFPLDTLDLLEQERGEKIEVSRSSSLDWTPVRESVKRYGMRNSNTMAIAPTATISNIAGCFPCIEPMFKNIYVKANMSGEFTIVNEYLVHDLKQLGLWNKDMLDTIKYFDGSIQNIPEIPDAIKAKYKEAFEIDPEWLIQLTAARSKWIDQSQSHNVFMRGTSGKKLNDIYMTAWRYGVKTTYYLRTLGASQIEKSTLDAKKFGFTQKREYGTTSANSASTAAPATFSPAEAFRASVDVIDTNASDELPVQACRIENPECDSCQ